MRFAKFIFSWLALCVLMAVALEFAYRNAGSTADYLFNTYYDKVNTIERLYIGNSHVGVFRDLYDDGVPEIANMSIGGQDIFRMYTVIKTVVPKSPKLKRIYMGLDYDLVGYNQVKNGDEKYDREYFPFTGEMYNDNLTNRLMSRSHFFRANRDMAYLFLPPKKKKPINFIPITSAPVATSDTSKNTDTSLPASSPAAVPAVTHKKLDPFMCRKRAEEHTLLKYKERYISENLNYLKTIVDVCQKHNIELIFFNPPKTECYKGSSNQKNVASAKHIVDSFVTANKLVYLDFYNDPAFNDDLFVDFDHLNPQGTVLLGDKLAAYH
ncbi:MAG TPA: hypothetical protein VK154_17720 [Chitinophagales bacterium]|nr:hypothetical protein [Chitinophagales bacterium]